MEAARGGFLGLRPDHLALPVSTDAGVSGRGDAWHTMSLVYVGCGLALVVCSGVLFVLQGAVGVPARVRRWTNPFASPLIALVGCAAYGVVASLVVLAVSRALSLPFDLNSTAGDIVWYVGAASWLSRPRSLRPGGGNRSTSRGARWFC